MSAARDAKTRVVVLGGGSGGLELAAGLGGRDDLDVTLVDHVSSHLWKPRLHEFAAGTVNSSLAEISFYVLGEFRGFRFEQGTVEGVDRARKRVRLASMETHGGAARAEPRSLPYDVLVVALGGVTADFGIPGVKDHAVRLDSQRDAEDFRERFIAAMIGARHTGEPARIVIVGSGATGTELAAHLRLAERAFYEPGVRPVVASRHLRVTILEAAPELMPGADARLRSEIAARLAAIEVEVRTGEEVAEVRQASVHTKKGDTLPSDVTVWAAGLVGHPVLSRLADFEMDKRGRIRVDDRLRSTVDPSILVLGDAASLEPPGSDKPLPPTAQAASQQAAWLIRHLPDLVRGGTPPAFEYSDKGRLISLARAGSVGRLVGFGDGDILVAGRFANAAYHSLQRRHQWSVLGPWRGSVAILADMVSPTRGPALKLHG